MPHDAIGISPRKDRKMKRDFSTLVKNIGYAFRNHHLLEEALRHSSFVNEQVDKRLNDNERLEFLGDAVLNLSVGHLLMKAYPEMNEGTLSRMRASLVNEAKLAEISRSLEIGGFIQFGKGEMHSNGSDKQSILADAFEAVIAAIYLDGGYDKAFAIIERLFKPDVELFDEISIISDYKSRLQEIAQINPSPLPSYEIVREFGPDHDKTFVVKLTWKDFIAEGLGKNKKAAEQNAAKSAIRMILQSEKQ